MYLLCFFVFSLGGAVWIVFVFVFVCFIKKKKKTPLEEYNTRRDPGEILLQMGFSSYAIGQFLVDLIIFDSPLDYL